MEDQRKEHFQQKEVQVQEAETNLTAPRIAGKPMKSPHSEARYSEAGGSIGREWRIKSERLGEAKSDRCFRPS